MLKVSGNIFSLFFCGCCPSFCCFALFHLNISTIVFFIAFFSFLFWNIYRLFCFSFFWNIPIHLNTLCSYHNWHIQYNWMQFPLLIKTLLLHETSDHQFEYEILPDRNWTAVSNTESNGILVHLALHHIIIINVSELHVATSYCISSGAGIASPSEALESIHVFRRVPFAWSFCVKCFVDCCMSCCHLSFFSDHPLWYLSCPRSYKARQILCSGKKTSIFAYRKWMQGVLTLKSLKVHPILVAPTGSSNITEQLISLTVIALSTGYYFTLYCKHIQRNIFVLVWRVCGI